MTGQVSSGVAVDRGVVPVDRRRSYEELAALVGWQTEQIKLLRAEVA